MDTHVVDSTTIYKTCIAWCAKGWVFEMYFFEGGICITTPAHSADARPPPPPLICSPAHPFTCYLDVETYTLMSRYLMSRHNPLISRHITAGTFGVVCLFIGGRVMHSVNIQLISNPIVQLTFSNIIPPYNLIYTYHDMMIRCTWRCLPHFVSEQESTWRGQVVGKVWMSWD